LAVRNASTIWLASSTPRRTPPAAAPAVICAAAPAASSSAARSLSLRDAARTASALHSSAAS
jgi:hypothetical protein